MEKYNSFAITYCGAEHTKKNKICQDVSVHYGDDLFEIAIVADGHGGESYFRSHIGAQIATEVTLDVLKRVATELSTLSGDAFDSVKNDIEHQESLFRKAKEEVVTLWREKVNADHDANPFTEEEIDKAEGRYKNRYFNERILEWAYGTTLIAAVVTPNCWFALQLGDGNCIERYRDRGFVESMPKDPCCDGALTTSLCQADALQHFRHYLSFELPQMVLVHTDGIDDSLLDDDTRNEVYLTVGASFVKGYDAAVEHIEKNIIAYIAENWKRDDTSMAGIVDVSDLEEQARMIYQKMVKTKKELAYKRACKRKDELDKICDSLQTTIESIKAKQRELEAEYKKISSRSKELLAVAQKNNEHIKKNVQVLEIHQKELESCNQIIANYVAEVSNHAEVPQAPEAPLHKESDVEEQVQTKYDENSSESVAGDSDSTQMDKSGSDFVDTAETIAGEDAQSPETEQEDIESV